MDILLSMETGNRKKHEFIYNLFKQEIGDYKICFDNTFSYLSSKTVYFEMINENEDDVRSLNLLLLKSQSLKLPVFSVLHF